DEGKQLPSHCDKDVHLCDTEKEIDKEIEIDKDKEFPQPSDDGQSTSETFEVLWKEYPRKEGKKKAFASYKRALKNGVTDEEIMEGLEKYNQYIKKEKTDRKYIAHGSTWFNENRWQDEYDVNSNKGSNEKTWAGSDF